MDDKLQELVESYEKHGFKMALFEIIKLMQKKDDGKISLSDINHLIQS